MCSIYTDSRSCLQPGRRWCSRSSGRRRPRERSTTKRPLPALTWTVSPPSPLHKHLRASSHTLQARLGQNGLVSCACNHCILDGAGGCSGTSQPAQQGLVGELWILPAGRKIAEVTGQSLYSPTGLCQPCWLTLTHSFRFHTQVIKTMLYAALNSSYWRICFFSSRQRLKDQFVSLVSQWELMAYNSENNEQDCFIWCVGVFPSGSALSWWGNEVIVTSHHAVGLFNQKT